MSLLSSKNESKSEAQGRSKCVSFRPTTVELLITRGSFKGVRYSLSIHPAEG